MEDVVIKVSKKIIGLLIFAVIALSLVSLTSYTKYIYAKDYTFIIEAECDPLQQTCYIRDCEEDCSSDDFEVYNILSISAANYDQCTSNGCENICYNEATSQLCTEFTCDIEAGDNCSGLE